MDCSPPGPSIHGIFQARVLEWIASAFSEIKMRQTNKGGCHSKMRTQLNLGLKGSITHLSPTDEHKL